MKFKGNCNYLNYLVKLFIVVITSSYTIPQNSHEGKILWTRDRRLSWEDYLGHPNLKDFGAVSMVKIDHDLAIKNDTIKFYVYAAFSRTTSWVKSENKSEFLLKHEQAHFDIVELFSRKYRKALLEYPFSSKDKVRAQAEILHSVFKDALAKEQRLYDIETDYSRDVESQEAWIKRISEQLALLESYSNPMGMRVVR